MRRITEKQAIASAVFAIADMGGRIYAPGFDATNYGRSVQQAIVTDMHEAWALSAFCIDRPFYGNNQHGWRLCQFCKGSGQQDIGPMFLTASAFNDAMRLMSAAKGAIPCAK